MSTTKPDMTYPWASAGSTSDPGSTKIQTGWVAEIPTAEKMNFVQNRADKAIAHIFENGVPQWDAGTTFNTGALTLYSNVLYQALQSATNKIPASQPTYWQRVYLISSAQNDALDGAASPSAGNPFATMDDLPSSADIPTLIQGSKDNYDTDEGYIDSGDVAEDYVANGTIFCSSLSAGAGGTTANWSDILPMTRNPSANRTTIEYTACTPYDNGSTNADDDYAHGTIIIDWSNSRILGVLIVSTGTKYALQKGYRMTGTIAASTANQIFTAVAQNGTLASFAAPRLKISNSSGNVINELPTVGKFNNVMYTIKDE